MSLIVRTPPAEEPVSLAAAKLALRIAHSEEDAFIATLIAAAREAVEAACGLALVTRAVRERMDAWRVAGPGQAALALGPVTAVETVRVADTAGVLQPLAAGAFAVDGQSRPPRLRFPAGLPLPAVPFAGLEVDYAAGFGSASAIPAGLRQAVLLTVARLYETGQADQSIPQKALELIAPYRRLKL